MSLCLSCHVYEDSSDDDISRCGHCGRNVLDRMRIHSTTACRTGWGRVARHDRLATIFLLWIASPAGLSFQGKYFRGEAKGLLFGAGSRSADVLIFSSIPAPGQTPDVPAAFDFMVSSRFSTDRASSRNAARRAAESSDAIVTLPQRRSSTTTSLVVPASRSRSPGM